MEMEMEKGVQHLSLAIPSGLSILDQWGTN
jgi:hypothetical protein